MGMEALESRLKDRIQILESYTKDKKKRERKGAERFGRMRIPFDKGAATPYGSTKYIKELIKSNEEKFFRPAQKSVVMAEKSIKEWRSNKCEEAIVIMADAYDCYKHKEIQFNLGKMYLAHGEHYIDGLVHLIEYYFSSNSYDFYSIELKKLFSLQESHGVLTGKIDGEGSTLNFILDKDGYLNFEDERERFRAEIPLSFKLPISLNLQRKDKQNIENEDYRYLKELLSDVKEKEYEVVIERHKFTKFFSDFYGTVLELTKDESNIVPLAAFEELKMDLFLSNLRREHYVRGEDEPAEIAFPEDESLMSILKIKVSPKNMNDFILLFREFARRNLISTESDWEIEDQFGEYEQQIAERENEYERRVEYVQLLEHGKEYAKLKCVLSNIKRETPEPYLFKEEEYQIFYNDYVSRFQPYYLDVIEDRKQIKEVRIDNTDNYSRISNQIGEVRNEILREKLVKQIIDIENQIKVNPNFSLNPMRVTLEGVIKEACRKRNIPVLKEKGNTTSSRNLMTLYKELKLNDLSKEILHLVNKGNTASHYDYLNSFISVDKNEAKELFDILLLCIRFMTKKFAL